jgi:Uncharacterized protein conserved in bacteria (DUF2252)
LLDRVNPDRLMINLIPDPVAEAALLADLRRQVGAALSGLGGARPAGPNQSKPEWMALARERHAQAVAAMDALIEGSHAWTGFGHGLRAAHAAAVSNARWREPRRNDQHRPGAEPGPKPLACRLPPGPTPPRHAYRSRPGAGSASYDFCIRQLRDWKASADIATMSPAAMRAYGQLCGWTLALGHARSGDRIAIAAYHGRSAAFDQAIREFAAAYADQNEHDYHALAAASRTGRVLAKPGV